MAMVLVFLVSISNVWADLPYIAVGEAKTRKTVLAVSSLLVAAPQLKDFGQSVEKTLTSDLLYVDYFKVPDAKRHMEKPGASIDPGAFSMGDWSAIGAEFLVKPRLIESDGKLALEANLFEVRTGKLIFSKKWMATRTEAKLLAHNLANAVVESLTGAPGIFLTKITMTCDRTGKKEIYVMDFDGTSVKQITSHRSIAMAPNWSPDNSKIAYSLYTRHKNNVRNIDLYEFDFASNTVRLLSNRTGINSGALYHPDGKHLGLTMSFLGNPEIFLLNPTKGEATRLTSSYGFDVDPTFSPDGKQLAFVSSRSGKPMVYAMNLDGTSVRRLTFAGRYNASPSWSPTNNKIAFAGWIDGIFDIFIMNPDGSKIERLTKKQSNNEDPSFAPDGQFIAFSSNRAGTKNIYVTNTDGSMVRRLTFGLGNCVAPKWSSLPK